MKYTETSSNMILHSFLLREYVIKGSFLGIKVGGFVMSGKQGVTLAAGLSKIRQKNTPKKC